MMGWMGWWKDWDFTSSTPLFCATGTLGAWRSVLLVFFGRFERVSVLMMDDERS
jgi:hypothetical protein